MQMQLGLLPMRSEQMPLGVGFQPPPPPPQIPHPSQAAMMAVAQQQSMMQQTLQAAQMTRYIPPPSTPIGGGGGFLNPYAAGAIGGGMGSMPNPMMMTAPAFGNYRPGGHFGSPHVGQGPIPPIFNPFAPSVQSSHFMTPAMQNLQIMQGIQARGTGMAAGIVDAGFRFGGAGIGALAGSAYGAVGGLAGGFLGHSIGGFLGNMATGPGVMDAARGRQIQNMSAPWMVSGGMLNPYTGQGMDRESARATATGLRHAATRDHNFGMQTGFNTEDLMRITQISSDQGLLATARAPEDITRKVKEISRAVKALVQITGDPDVRNAIASLGQMKDLGFVGTAGQAGAVANRAMFARMAGVSQGAMNDLYGMPGAMMAQQSGMAGATGYMAGMTGGAMANIARSSGALDSLQMSRAGGVQGLGQINAMAQLGAMNQDIYMAAALKKGAKGIDIDIDAYRKAQTMTISEVSNLAANNLREMGKEGIFELRTRKQEFKDKLAQQMSPFEMSMNVVRQAQGLQKSVPGMNMGSALFATARSNALGAGMGDEQAESAARSLELQFTSREHWDGQIQQLKAQRRQVADQERAKRGRFRTPGALTRAGRGIDDALFGVSDTVSSPFRSLSNHLERVSEDEATMRRGERVMRFGGSSLIQSDADRAMAVQALQGSAFQQGEAGGGSFNRSFSVGGGAAGWGASAMLGFGAAGAVLGDSNMRNRVSSFFGLSRTSDANRINEIAHATRGHAFGNSLGESFGNAQSSLGRIQDVMQVAQAADRSTRLSGAKNADVRGKLEARLREKAGPMSAAELVSTAAGKLHARAPTAGIIDSAGALDGSQMKASIVETLEGKGMKKAEAEAFYEDNKEDLNALMLRNVMAYGEDSVKETIMKAIDAETAMGGISGASSSRAVNAEVSRLQKVTAVSSRFSEKDLSSLKGLVGSKDRDVLKMAGLMSAQKRGGKGVRQNAERLLGEMAQQMGEKKFGALQAAAEDLAPQLDGKTEEILRHVAGTGKMSTLNERFDNLDEFFGGKMAQSAQRFALEKISDVTGRKDLGSDLNKAIASMSDEQLSDARLGSKSQLDLLKKARGGDKKALADWVASMGPGAEKELLGGGGGGALRSLDERIAEMQQLRDEVAVEGGDKATQLFAEGSTMLAEAAKDLKEATENMKIAQNAPFWQSWIGER